MSLLLILLSHRLGPSNCAIAEPPGYVHAMIEATWQPNAISVTPRGRYNDKATGQAVGASAQASEDGKTVVVRLTNMGETAATAELVVPGFSGGASKPTSWTLQSPGDKDGANPPSDPTKISPQRGTVGVGDGRAQSGDTVQLPPFSYVVVEYGGASRDII